MISGALYYPPPHDMRLRAPSYQVTGEGKAGERQGSVSVLFNHTGHECELQILACTCTSAPSHTADQELHQLLAKGLVAPKIAKAFGSMAGPHRRTDVRKATLPGAASNSDFRKSVQL